MRSFGAFIFIFGGAKILKPVRNSVRSKPAADQISMKGVSKKSQPSFCEQNFGW
jgi:hypothetical protein